MSPDQQALVVELLEQFLDSADDVTETMEKDATTFSDVDSYAETLGLHQYKMGLARELVMELQLEEGRHRG